MMKFSSYWMLFFGCLLTLSATGCTTCSHKSVNEDGVPAYGSDYSSGVVITWKSLDNERYYIDPRRAVYYVNGISVGEGIQGFEKVLHYLEGLPERSAVLFSPVEIPTDEPISFQNMRDTLNDTPHDSSESAWLSTSPKSKHLPFGFFERTEWVGQDEILNDKYGPRCDLAVELLGVMTQRLLDVSNVAGSSVTPENSSGNMK